MATGLCWGHRENYAASRDTESFSSELFPRSLIDLFLSSMPAGAPHVPTPMPINLDPPDHTKFRAPINPAFSPRPCLYGRKEILRLADVLIDQVVERGHCDFIPGIGEPLPVQVFLRLLGLPLERQAEFRDLIHMFLAPMIDPMGAIARMRKVADAMDDVILARRDDPLDDLISLLWRTEIDGEPMTVERLEDYGVLLFIAGLGTAINSMGYGIRHLARDPELQQQSREYPRLIPEAANV